MAHARLALSFALVLVLLPVGRGAAEQPEVNRNRAAVLAQPRTLERLQASAEDVVATLERLERQRDLPEQLADLDELRDALEADNRTLIGALARAFARGLADPPELEDTARRHDALSGRLGQQVSAALRLTREMHRLDDFSQLMTQRLMRLRDAGGSRERTAAFEREAARVEADRRTLTSEAARTASALRESLRELSTSSCTLHLRLEIAGAEACRAARLTGRMLTAMAAETRAHEAVREQQRMAVEPPATAPAPAPAVPRILHSVYSLFDEKTQEPPGYGLYTYVLFPVPRPQNQTFIAALSTGTDVADEERTVNRGQLNLFSLPVKDAAQLPRAIEDPEHFASREVYDYAAARDFLFRLCRNPQADELSVCAGSAWRGPYLLTHPRPQSQLETFELPYLFVDLSHVRERAYGEFIRAVKEQVKRPDFTDREKIDTFRLRLLNITLSAADWVEPISDGLEGIISVAAR